MATTTVSSGDFDRDTGRAKIAARKGPVVITDRGMPAHVLLTFEDYQRLTGARDDVIDLLGLPPGVEDAELNLPRARDLARPADLS